MSLSTALELSQQELESELQEQYPFRVGVRSADYESAAARCPPDKPYTVTRFGRYAVHVRELPESQVKKLQRIADEIRNSLSGTAAAKPITQVFILGHADPDPARESREPGFQQYISEVRAYQAYNYVSCNLGETLARRVRWIRVGRGARSLAVPKPRTEAERKCNRRVEFVLVRTSSLPRMDPSKIGEASLRREAFAEYYHIALQGTSGQYDKPYVATQKAKEIAEMAVERIAQRAAQMQREKCPEDVGAEFVPYFKDALQGTASKFSDPAIAVEKAWNIAGQSRYFVQEQEITFYYWKYAQLPQPMDIDCEAGVRAESGPPNQVLCRTHGHVLDATARMVIAHDLEEYKKRSQKRPPGRIQRRR